MGSYNETWNWQMLRTGSLPQPSKIGTPNTTPSQHLSTVRTELASAGKSAKWEDIEFIEGTHTSS